MRFLFFAASFSILSLFLLSCAKQSSPSGGPKDSIPPTLVHSIPVQKQLNFKSNKIELTFSEFIGLNNPKDQIIITPAIGKDYKITAKKKTITIDLDKNLEDSTTYTLSFRESIRDITEKNPTKNLKLAFSTGPYIDSLIIEGAILDILTGKEIKDATVALYQPDTFNIFKHKPSYITKTDDKGSFKLENLKAGKYYIYAYDDKNKNLIVDTKSESYGFLIDQLEVSEDIRDVAIPIQRLDARPLKLSNARPYGNYFNIKTTKYLKEFLVSSDSVHIYSSFAEDAANVKIYNTFKTLDSLKINFSANDSIGNKLDTILYVKFNTKPSDKEKLSSALEKNNIEAATGALKVKLKFNKPIVLINYDSILFSYDSADVVKFQETDLIWNKNHDQVEIQKVLDKQRFIKETNQPAKPSQSLTKKTSPTSNNEVNKFILGKGGFISVEQDSTGNMKETSKILREEETAILLVKINTTEKNYILEILDKSYKIIESVKNTQTIKLQNLPPSGYILRLVIDKNGNGTWDQGNFYTRQEPEPITFYRTEKGEQTVNLKANWEVGPLLITYQ
jgi:uncharacterized protein (DUF2141 family)